LEWVVLALLIVLLYGGSQGWFSSTSTTIINQTTIEQLNQPPSLSCPITFDRSQVCTGDFVQGTARGYPNDACDLYYRVNGGAWMRDTTTPTYHLDASGTYTETRQAANPGVFEFKGICGQCIAGVGTINVVDCPQEDCHTTCKGLGYYSGYAGQCDPVEWRYEGMTQVGGCCCYQEEIPEGYRCFDSDYGIDPETFGICYDAAHPTGIADTCISGMDQWVNENFCSGGACLGASTPCPLTTEHCVSGECVLYDDGDGGGGGTFPQYGGYSSCEAWADAEGKEFWSTPEPTLLECEDNAWNYCNYFGWSLLYYDWDTYDCCIFECSGGWE
jgi:hypothetical protein